MRSFTKNWVRKFIRLYFLSGYLLVDPFTPDDATAADIQVHGQETVPVAINSRLGTLVEFPRPLLVVSAAAQFKIQRIATQVDKEGKAVDVRIVKITAKPRATSEEVAFVLNGHRALSLQLKAKRGAAKHQRLVFAAADVTRGGAFLTRELALMQQLLKDEHGKGFARTVTNQKFSLRNHKLKATQIRQFSGQYLSGKVFVVENRGKQTLAITPQLFNLPRAALFHTDYATLTLCKTGICKTTVHLVLRTKNFIASTTPTSLPFLRGGKR